jgi:hypothetical protein
MTDLQDTSIFSSEFLKVDPADVSTSIRELGYFCFPSAVKPAFLGRLDEELAAHVPSANLNDVAPVWFNEQYFFPHALACSNSYFQYVTASFLRSICRAKFGRQFRLKCHRYYETGPGHSMEWHADNVTNEGTVTDVDGLIFILYVNDVNDGEFQLVSNSFKDRKSGIWSYNYTNKYIDETFSSKIKSFKMPAGSIIVYDTYGIHRAKPIVSKSFTRKSIFFQVDTSPDHAEKILLNPAFISERDSELLDYLGFGQKHDFPANPPSSLRDVPLKPLLGFQKIIIRALLARVNYGLTKRLLTHDARMRFTAYKRDSLRRLRLRYPSFYGFLKRTIG